MATRTQKPKSTRQSDPAVIEEPAPTTKLDGHNASDEIKAEMDELLKEIDEVLEENAEDFVRSYIQKGGE